MTFDPVWHQWPVGRPPPTEEEFKIAEKRYELTQSDDGTDWNCGLKFVMATYNMQMWWHFFFPNEKYKLQWMEDGQLGWVRE